MPKTSDPHKFAPRVLIGEFLKAEMIRRNLNPTEFEKLTDVQYYTLHRMLERDTVPTIDVLWKLSRGLGIDLVILIALAHPEWVKTMSDQAEWVLDPEIREEILNLNGMPADVATFVTKFKAG